MSGSTEARSYKKTLNLPKTGFAMKANLVQNEPASQKRWEASGLYERVQGDADRAEPFVFHDGPPYANATLHLGHFLNKTLKDFVVRSKLMEGKRVPFVPGWDCHGLPIEHKVLQELEEKGKLEKLRDLDEDTRRTAVRKACQSYAEQAVKRHTGQLKRMLTLADYDHPYLTMHESYEGAVLEVFATLVERGLVYRQLKAVHWSVANETALADAELEYRDREDISVFVDFEAEDAGAVYGAFGLEGEAVPDQRPSFMIWTTTPWTLPANLAIAVHKKFEYALVRMDGNFTVLAKELVGPVSEMAGAESVEVVATSSGGALVGLRYRHPFVAGVDGRPGPDFSEQPDAAMRGSDPSGVYRVVSADYVTLEDGTGLVHTAPGHGAEDYLTGLREKLPVYCPVTEDGTYDRSVPEAYRGLSVWEANERITEDLRASGHLFHSNRFMHSYPHDWRSKTPVIFRATEQWFVGVDEGFARDGDEPGVSGRTLRERALDATSGSGAGSVRFYPEWGRNRMRGMLENRPDWCISRQRAWGLPIPAFYTADGETVLTPASVRAVARAFREEGSDSWFERDAAHLLRHYDAAADGDLPQGLRGMDVSSLRKGYDIFDVWFESGSSWNAVMRERFGEGSVPVDLYLEGSDQHRGWFQLSLLPGLGVLGESPYRSVLTHGFMVDPHGRKMSKSEGNTLDVDRLLEEYGADVCRWFLGSISYETDVKTGEESFKIAGEAYRKVRNTLRFMLSNLSDFEGGADARGVVFPPESVDAWMLGELDAMSGAVRASYEAYEFQRATTRLYNFCNETLSAVYLAAVKDRLYCDAAGSERRQRTQAALWLATDALSRLLAPVMPHTADEAWRELHGLKDDASACVHAERFAAPVGASVHESWPAFFSARDEALRAMERVRAAGDVENPLDFGVSLPDPEGRFSVFDAEDLADLCGVSRLELTDGGEIEVRDLRDRPVCERSRKRHATVRVRGDGGMLSDRDAAAAGVS